MTDDPGIVDTGQGHQCTFDFFVLFCFLLFFLLLPTLRIPWGGGWGSLFLVLPFP